MSSRLTEGVFRRRFIGFLQRTKRRLRVFIPPRVPLPGLGTRSEVEAQATTFSALETQPTTLWEFIEVEVGTMSAVETQVNTLLEFVETEVGTMTTVETV